jgi:hypothetical protein
MNVPRTTKIIDSDIEEVDWKLLFYWGKRLENDL